MLCSNIKEIDFRVVYALGDEKKVTFEKKKAENEMQSKQTYKQSSVFQPQKRFQAFFQHRQAILNEIYGWHIMHGKYEMLQNELFLFAMAMVLLCIL